MPKTSPGNVNLVFLHGVNAQPSGYSQALYGSILRHYQRLAREAGKNADQARQAARHLHHKELFWAHRTADLTSRFSTLQYELNQRKGKWDFLLKSMDPLIIQILHYVRDKGFHSGPMNILRAVHREFQRLRADRANPTVVIAHSLGSLIAFDYLFGFRKYRLPHRKSVEALITLGSPLPLFTAAMGYVESGLRLPPRVRRWLNVLDPDDGAARYCRPHFKRLPVEDIELNCGWSPIGAHLGYWKSQALAELIAKRLLAWGL